MLAFQNGTPLRSEAYGNSYDWALIEIEDPQFKVANEVVVSEKSGDILHPQDIVKGVLTGEVLAVAGSCNIKGNILGAPSFVQLSNTTAPVEMAVILLDRSLS